jgi:hypothetical protein
MSTLTDLQAQRAALVAARNSGTLRTTFRSGGTERTVWFKSDTELAAAIAAVDRDIAALEGRRVNTFLPSFSKGL